MIGLPSLDEFEQKIADPETHGVLDYVYNFIQNTVVRLLANPRGG
jgi:hypothetical protein